MKQNETHLWKNEPNQHVLPLKTGCTVKKNPKCDRSLPWLVSDNEGSPVLPVVRWAERVLCRLFLWQSCQRDGYIPFGKNSKQQGQAVLITNKTYTKVNLNIMWCIIHYLVRPFLGTDTGIRENKCWRCKAHQADRAWLKHCNFYWNEKILVCSNWKLNLDIGSYWISLVYSRLFASRNIIFKQKANFSWKSSGMHM